MQITTNAQRGQTQFLKAPSSWVCLSFVLAVGLLSSGCASVTGSPNQNVSVQAREQSGTEVKGANCELTNNKGKWFVTTPGSVGIHRSNDDLQVLCTKEGIEPGRAAVVSETKGSMFGNIILGGGIGAIIDHNNGSAYESLSEFLCERSHTTIMSFNRKDSYDDNRPSHPGQAA